MDGKSKEHIQLLDLFRGVAILGVFLFHCLGASFGYDHLPWGRWLPVFPASWPFLAVLPFTLGWAGVAVFFVVSGFCIHLSFLKSAQRDWRGFFVRRFFRIYPPYALALVLFAFVFAPTRLGFHSLIDWAQIGSHALLLHNLDFRFFYGINSAFWSIAVEAQLYLIYPLLLALVDQFGWRRTLIFLCVLECSLRGASDMFHFVTGHSLGCWLTDSPFCFWFSWAIGAALADAFVRKRPLPFRSVSIVAVGVAAIATSFIRPLNSFSFLFFALLTAATLARLLNRQVAAAQLRWPIAHLRKLGVVSYSFYLLHEPLVFSWGRLVRRLPLLEQDRLLAFAMCLCGYPLIYLLARLYYRTVEMRCIAAGKRVLQKLRAHALPPASSAV